MFFLHHFLSTAYKTSTAQELKRAMNPSTKREKRGVLRTSERPSLQIRTTTPEAGDRGSSRVFVCTKRRTPCCFAVKPTPQTPRLDALQCTVGRNKTQTAVYKKKWGLAVRVVSREREVCLLRFQGLWASCARRTDRGLRRDRQ